jgi:transcriptional regulator with XRE-family HTH domain
VSAASLMSPVPALRAANRDRAGTNQSAQQRGSAAERVALVVPDLCDTGRPAGNPASFIAGRPVVTGQAPAGGRSLQPGLYRQQVRDALRRAREAAGLTQQQVAEELDWSSAKMVRIETGVSGVTVTDLRALPLLYQVADETEVGLLVEMARASRQPPWCSGFRVATPDLAGYLEAERPATAIRGFRALTIPGLLQTPDYTWAILRVTGTDRVGERVRLQLARQQLLDHHDCRTSAAFWTRVPCTAASPARQ